jgi:hypothetical protein
MSPGLEPLKALKMNLDNFETLLLLQFLFHLKASGSFSKDKDTEDLLHELYEKVLLNVNRQPLEDRKTIKEQDSFFIGHLDEESLEEDCSWKEEDSESKVVAEYSFSYSQALELSPIRVDHDGDKKTFKFVPGISSGVDIDLNDGEEIIFDVVNVERRGDSFSVNTVEGWVDFEVQKFPKSWTTLFQLNKTGEAKK